MSRFCCHCSIVMKWQYVKGKQFREHERKVMSGGILNTQQRYDSFENCMVVLWDSPETWCLVGVGVL